MVAVVGLLGAFLWELYQKDPAVDFHLLKERNFLIATMTMFMLGFVLYGSTALLPIFLQTLLGYTRSAERAGAFPGRIRGDFLLPVVGKLLTRLESRWLVVFGLSIAGISLFHMAHFNLEIDFRTAMMAGLIQSAGMAFLFVPINVMAFYFSQRER